MLVVVVVVVVVFSRDSIGWEILKGEFHAHDLPCSSQLVLQYSR